MRYTECRLTRLATELLRDIDADTVDFKPNYDESRREPTVLPSRFPNLLVNGSSGIAVGMATNMPPHNLGEIIDALVALIDEPDDRRRAACMKHVKGPDFPTGAHHRRARRASARRTAPAAAGSSCARAPTSRSCAAGKTAIIVTELPYGVKKGGDDGVIKKIADLVKDKVHHRDLRPRGPLRPDRHADPDRAEARRDPAGRR